MSTESLLKKPEWIRVAPGSGPEFRLVETIIHSNRLHTVCDEALCPNKGECWSHGHATVMILGGKCTRSCKFCNVHDSEATGTADWDEPARVAAALKQTRLSEIVLTSVTRDDLPDGGAGIWVKTICELRRTMPQATIEVLVPDFAGNMAAARQVIDTRPDVFGHNLETVPRLYPAVRPQAVFDRSLDLLKLSADCGLLTKTSLMLGLGETSDEVKSVMNQALSAGCRIIFLGQYLQPSRAHHRVVRYVDPSEFDELGKTALNMGFSVAVSKPLARSSYHSDAQSELIRRVLHNKEDIRQL